MSGCLDNVHCECIELGEKRNAVASVCGSLLYFTGVWILIGCLAVFTTDEFSPWLIVVAGVGSLSMFMINAISNSQVRGESMSESLLGTKGARLWLLLGFVLGFGALIASIWIMFAQYALKQDNSNVWPGVLLLVQNLLIFVGSLLYKFGRQEDLWSM